jgi:hypothetical protein
MKPRTCCVAQSRYSPPLIELEGSVPRSTELPEIRTPRQKNPGYSNVYNREPQWFRFIFSYKILKRIRFNISIPSMNKSFKMSLLRICVKLLITKLYTHTYTYKTIGLWDVENPTLSTQSAHGWRWCCQTYEPAALYHPEIFSGTHFR